ncbi:MAG: ribosomal-protein-alanine N-acetyltransferase [Ruminococcaceae bacterium]|nr:ribosomal-protein-alanine N-acetyltransferase [Oscillospiraceae bacterium]
MAAEHIPAVAALEVACFSLPWSAEALREELANPFARFLVALDGDTVVGYIGLHAVAGEGAVTNVAVSPTHRRRGIARALLRAQARADDLLRITLEVRQSNAAARALYEQEGFRCDGIRPRFYEHPAEDAVLYSLYLKEE